MTAAEIRNQEYQRLGVDPKLVWNAPSITPQLRQIAKQISKAATASNSPLSDLPTNPYYYLHASEDPEARKVLEMYYSVPKTSRKALPIEAFCIAAGVSTLRILEIIVATCVRMGASSSSIIASVSHPRVVEKTVEMALTDDGHADRETLHKATGFLPTPRGGPSIRVVQNNQQQSTVVAAVAAPPPEQTIRKLVDRFNERTLQSPAAPLQLPDPTPLPSFVVHNDKVPVEISSEEDEDES